MKSIVSKVMACYASDVMPIMCSKLLEADYRQMQFPFVFSRISKLSTKLSSCVIRGKDYIYRLEVSICYRPTRGFKLSVM